MTEYTDSEGKVHVIAEMNAFHIVNAFAKTVRINESGRCMAEPSDAEREELEKALRIEIMNRLSPPKAV